MDGFDLEPNNVDMKVIGQRVHEEEVEKEVEKEEEPQV
jgi:hypothetical protein